MKISYIPARLFVLCSLVFFLHACDKTDDTVDNNEYVVKEELDNKGRVINSYEYNDKWQLTKQTYSWQAKTNDWRDDVTTYFYNTDERLDHTETLYLYSSFAPVRIEYSYNADGKIAVIKRYQVSQGTPVLINTVEYSYNGQQIVVTGSDKNGIYYVGTFTLDGNGNIVKMVARYPPGEPVVTEEYLDYDDKKNVGGPVAGSVTSKNNYRKRISTHSGSSTISYYKYEYNNAGYVTKRIIFVDKSMKVSKFNLTVRK